jgi:hypothetical protein
LALSTLSGCCHLGADITVNDHALYYQKQASPNDWVTEMHFLTDGTQDFTQDQWSKISEGMVCTPLADWGDINKMITDFCSAPGVKCDYKVSGQSLKTLLNGFFLRLELASGRHFEHIR